MNVSSPSKKLTELFRRYQVETRTHDTIIVHAVKQRPIRVIPLNFAVYELTIKAIYASNMAAPEEWREQFVSGGPHRWYQMLATRGGFQLIAPFKDADSHAADYRYGCQLLAKAGLYYDLLD